MLERKSFNRWRPHPWHGLAAGPNPPEIVSAFIEITPFDVVKYEIDKVSGYVCVDRPLRGASAPPALYGFIPRTLCQERVAQLTPGAVGGDGDPLDIFVLSERPIARAEVIVKARVIGGFQVLDGGEADDKIVAVLDNDLVWHQARSLSDAPDALIDRLEHYLTTYKLVPGAQAAQLQVVGRYSRAAAHEVIEAAMQDYAGAYG